MKRILSSCSAVVALALSSTSVLAQEIAQNEADSEEQEEAFTLEDPAALEDSSALEGDSGITVSGHVGFYTDYRFRGVSLSDEDFVIQGSIVLGKDGFYVGAWGSPAGFLGDTVDPVTGATINGAELEIDYFAGYKFAIADKTNLDLQVKRVTFPGQDDAAFFRVSAFLSGEIGGVGWGLNGNYEPDQSKTLLDGEDNFYINATANVPLAEGFSLSGSIGYEDGAFADDKVDWLVGVNKSLGSLDLAAQYIGTSESGFMFGDTVVFSVSRAF